MYVFVLPAGQDHITAPQIREYFVNYKVQAPGFMESDGIDLKIDGSGCEIRVKLTGADGLAFPENGVHRALRCGLDKVKPCEVRCGVILPVESVSHLSHEQVHAA